MARKGFAALQLILKYSGHNPGDIDGLIGPQTLYALAEFDHVSVAGKLPEPWRPEPEAEPKELDLPVANNWPLQSDMTRFYGAAGGAQCTAGLVKLPFAMHLAWDESSTIKIIRCHEKVAQSVERVLDRIASAYSAEDIQKHGFNSFGGCDNFRKMLGGIALSTHAWGGAIDFDPLRNQLKWGADRAYLASKACEAFFRCWETEGWLSLGRTRNYDWMHVQAARLG